jgi:hypothetical protein
MDMVTGRFRSQDPENGIVTDPKTLHKYMYAGGDPVNFADPSGRAQAAAGTMGGAAGEYAGLIMNKSIASVSTSVGVSIACIKMSTSVAREGKNGGPPCVIPPTTWMACIQGARCTGL